MARKARVVVNNNYVHVLTSAIEGKLPFVEDSMKQFYMTCMATGIKKYGVGLIAYVIIDTHTHLLLKAADTSSLSAYMTYLNSTFAKHYNATMEHEGKVFKDRYKAEIIDGRQQICNAIKFIQGDPLRLQIVDNLDNYPYSSYYEYQRGASIVDIVDAGRHFNTSPRAVASMMVKPSDEMFYDSILRETSKDYLVFEYIINKFNIQSESDLCNDNMLKQVAKGIRELTHMGIDDMATQLGVPLDRLKQLMID